MSLRDRYAELVVRYADTGDEAALAAIAQMGRELVGNDVPPESIGDLHASALRSLGGPDELADAASTTLTELLMAYGLAFRHRLAVEAQRSFLQSALDALSAYVAVLDQDGRVLAVNEAWRRFRLGRPLVIARCGAGTDYLRTCEKDAPHGLVVAEGVRAVLEGRKDEATAIYESNERWFQVRVNAYQGPGPRRLVVAHEDVTEQKRAELRLRDLNTRLERAVAERTHDLEETNRELEAYSYAMAHDLKTPLRSIQGFVSMLEEDYEDAFDDEGRDFMERITANTERLAMRIDAFLSLSRLGRQHLRRQPIDLSAVATGILGQLTTAEPARRAELNILPGGVVVGDPDLLPVVVENLVTNAWKFSAGADPARVELEHEEAEGGTWFHVRDNGAGFDPNHATRLFKPFQRLHRDDEFPGTGLGLATVARIIANHRGKVVADASLGGGATFSFFIPEQRPHPD